MRHVKFCLSTIALIALSACVTSLGGNGGHLRSNGAQDSVIDPASPPPTDLVGLSNQTVLDRLGIPEISRVEGNVLYMRYSTFECLLDIYLKADQLNGELRVEHLDVRPRTGIAHADMCPIVEHEVMPNL